MKGIKFIQLAFIILIQLALNISNVSAESNFDHSTTGFELTGQHNYLPCESCHVRGIFKGLPDTCDGCHERFSQIGGSLKPVTHVTTRASCDDCHTDNSWSVIRMDHADVTDTCITCHDGIKYIGKPTGHIVSSDTCDDCHLTVAWIPARFDHFGITDTCITCHNGLIATGKDPVSHVQSSDVCDDCHTTNGWLPARFDHVGIDTGCFDCHNGTTATGKHATHVASADSCEDCHNTNGWLPALFDHTGVTGDCDTCHNGDTATGVVDITGHLNTIIQCDTCHFVTGWTPIKSYLHISSNYPGDHTGVNLGCYSCHISGQINPPVASRPGYYPDCAACHWDEYERDPHENNPLEPDYLDCSGTCHKPSPEHQLFHNEWGN